MASLTVARRVAIALVHTARRPRCGTSESSASLSMSGAAAWMGLRGASTGSGGLRSAGLADCIEYSSKRRLPDRRQDKRSQSTRDGAAPQARRVFERNRTRDRLIDALLHLCQKRTSEVPVDSDGFIDCRRCPGGKFYIDDRAMDSDDPAQDSLALLRLFGIDSHRSCRSRTVSYQTVGHSVPFKERARRPSAGAASCGSGNTPIRRRRRKGSFRRDQGESPTM